MFKTTTHDDDADLAGCLACLLQTFKSVSDYLIYVCLPVCVSLCICVSLCVILLTMAMTMRLLTCVCIATLSMMCVVVHASQKVNILSPPDLANQFPNGVDERPVRCLCVCMYVHVCIICMYVSILNLFPCLSFPFFLYVLTLSQALFGIPPWG
jgi:hypothetical protein